MQKLYNEQNVENIADAIRNRKHLIGYNELNVVELANQIFTSYTKNENSYIGKIKQSSNEYFLKNIKENTSYTISGKITGVSGFDSYGYIVYTDGTTKSIYGSSSSQPTEKTFTFSTDITKTISSLKIYFYDIYRINEYILSEWQIKEGAEEPYEPYCKYKISEMSQAIKLLPRKDLYEKALLNQKTKDVEGTDITITDSADMQFNSFDINGNSVQNNEPTPQNPQEIKSSGDNGNINIRIQNSTKTSEQIITIPVQKSMRAIKEIRDDFVKIDGIWFERHKIGEKTFTGNETIGLQSSTSTRNAFFIDIDDIVAYTVNTETPKIMHSKFRAVPQSESWSSGMISRAVASQTSVFFILSSNTSIDDLKNIIINTTLYYELKAPIYLPCTQEQIEKLEQLTELISYEPTTYINSTDEVAPYIKAKYCVIANIKHTELNYIRGTGTQYIDTGIKADNYTQIEVLVNTQNSTGDQSIFGSRAGYNSNDFSLWSSFNGQYMVVGMGNTYEPRVPYPAFNKNAIINMNSTTGAIDINYGTGTYQKTFLNTGISANLNIFLFAKNENHNAVRISKSINIYYFKIWQKDVLVLDLIPVKDSEGKVCMYDKVSGNYLYNKGTGEFIAGE